jgi:hypothetical protein
MRLLLGSALAGMMLAAGVAEAANLPQPWQMNFPTRQLR